MALYAPHHYEKLFAPLRGKRIGYFLLTGNVGDELNHQAARELFGYFDIDFREIHPGDVRKRDLAAALDELVISGGGNMGSDFYSEPFAERRIALKMGLPTTVFPQTFLANREDLSGYKKIFVRERRSRSLNVQFELVPDLAMGLLDVPRPTNPEAKIGVFLRRDIEARFSGCAASMGDPAQLSSTCDEYLELAGLFEHVFTDRLHFAIAALLRQRKVSLLPSSYWKNRAVYETWLRGFECEWLNGPDGISADPGAISRKVLYRLSGSPARVVDWSCRPVRQPEYTLYRHDDRTAIRRQGGPIAAWCNDSTGLIWTLCDGSRTVEEILETLLEAYPEDAIAVARDLQDTLQLLKKKQMLYLEATEPGEYRPPLPRAVGGTRRAGIELMVEAPATTENSFVLSATLKDGGRSDRSIWFELDRSCENLVSRNADPFLLVVLMYAMRSGRDVVVRNAPVSSGLLSNLERFQQVWCRWRTVLGQVVIEAEIDRDQAADDREGALLTFSGGIDSCFTAFEYVSGVNVQHQHKAASALMIQGFDIPLSPESDQVLHEPSRAPKKFSIR
jgi:hypothetical protein